MKAGAGCGSTECPVGGLTGGNLSYKPWILPRLGGTEDTGYLNNNKNAIGGYKYSRGKNKSSTNKSKTFKNYKYKGGGLVGGLFGEFMNNFYVAGNAIRGYPPPTDPTVYKDQLVNTRVRL
jgi:hypothetical protein